MRQLGLRGVMRGKVVKTTHSDGKALCPLDRVRLHLCLNLAAFVIDVYARRIVGWRVSSSMRTDFVLDAL